MCVKAVETQVLRSFYAGLRKSCRNAAFTQVCVKAVETQLLCSFYAGLRKSCMQKLRKSRRYLHLRNCCVSAAFAHDDYFYEALRKSFVKAGFSAALRKSRLFRRCQYRRLLRSFCEAFLQLLSCAEAAEKLAFFRKGTAILLISNRQFKD